MDRRAEVAEELRDHLSQLVEAKCAEGMSEASAVEAALVDFGSLDEIRRQLRKQQGLLDRQKVFSNLRRYRWPVVVGCGLFGAAVALVAPAPASASLRCLVGICIFVGMLGILSTMMFSVELLTCRLQHVRPRSEFHIQRSFYYWSTAVFTFLIVTLAMGPLFIGVFGFLAQNGYLQSFLNFSPQLTEGAHWTFWRNMAIGAMESPLRSFLLPLLTVMVVALCISLYERSRCVGGDNMADASIAE